MRSLAIELPPTELFKGITFPADDARPARV
jgi:hypothetical protein